MSAGPYLYDAFISYSHSDRPWVDDRLLPSLERAGLKIAIDHRDFKIGEFSQENMARCVDSSRHVVIVLSPEWVKSEWASYEFLIASAEDPVARRNKIIPLLIARAELPRQIGIRTYANFVNPASFDSEIAKVVQAIRLEQTADPGAAIEVKPSEPEPAPLADWQPVLADLVVRGGKAHPQARTALCLEIGIDPNDLSFMSAPPRAFAIELISQLEQTGNSEGLLRICAALRPILQGSLAKSLKAAEQAVRGMA